MGPLLVFGRSGQVATCLNEEAARRGIAAVRLGRGEIDLSSGDAVAAAIAAHRPAAIINAAAYTAVDKAESDEAEAFRLNAEAPGVIAAAAAAAGLPLLHISTDYVFDGQSPRPYREDDATAPQSVYGRSKLAGEAAVRAAQPRHLILRTAWVYSEHGTNFLRTMLRLGAERDTLGIVDDQHGCPTYAGDLAAGLIELAVAMQRPEAPAGTYHMAATGTVSWHGFAEAIFAAARERGLPAPTTLRAITTADYPTPARRPANSSLDCSRLADTFGITLPPWREGLARAMARLAAARA